MYPGNCRFRKTRSVAKRPVTLLLKMLVVVTWTKIRQVGLGHDK